MLKTLAFILVLAALLVRGEVNAQELVHQEFHANGKLHTTRFSDGRSEHRMSYYESGRLYEIGTLREGRPEGEWKRFAENGSVIADGRFVHGVRQGVWEFRDAQGRLSGRSEYVDGVLVRAERYATDGALLAERTY